MTPARQRSRRGDGASLRADILRAAGELLAETGAEDAVSIRAVADRVGVSAPSIYLHFADKDELIAEVCNQVFVDLDEAMERAAEDVADPMDALRERGLAYVRFAVANPEHYRLVTMRRPTSATAGPADEMLRDGAFAHLLSAVARCQAAGMIRADEDPVALGLVLWSAAHGIASLMIAKPFLPWDGERVLLRAIDSIGCGLVTTSLMPDYQGALESLSSQSDPGAH